MNRDPIGEVGSSSWIQRRSAVRQFLFGPSVVSSGLQSEMMQNVLGYALIAGGPNLLGFCGNDPCNSFDLYGEFSLRPLRCAVLASQHLRIIAQLLLNRADYIAWIVAVQACQPSLPPSTFPELAVQLGCTVILAIADDTFDRLDEEYWELIKKDGEVIASAKKLCCGWAESF